MVSPLVILPGYAPKLSTRSQAQEIKEPDPRMVQTKGALRNARVPIHESEIVSVTTMFQQLFRDGLYLSLIVDGAFDEDRDGSE
jgi:hypothetical protein